MYKEQIFQTMYSTLLEILAVLLEVVDAKQPGEGTSLEQEPLLLD